MDFCVRLKPRQRGSFRAVGAGFVSAVNAEGEVSMAANEAAAVLVTNLRRFIGLDYLWSRSKERVMRLAWAALRVRRCRTKNNPPTSNKSATPMPAMPMRLKPGSG